MSRRNNQNNNYNGNQYYGNGQYYGGNNNQYYGNQNGQYNQQNGQYYNQRQYGQNRQYNNQNGQYYNQNPNNKFGLYDQPQQTNNNGKKTINKELLIKIGMFAGFAIILLLIVFAINSCGKKKEACEEDYKQVGSESHGYVCVPTDWVTFIDETRKEGSTVLQYSSVDANYVVTLEVINPEPGDSVQGYAFSYENELKKREFSTQSSETDLEDFKAKQVIGHNTKDNVWVSVYFFESEDKKIHFVGIEGPNNVSEEFEIPKSYELKK